MEAEVPTPHLIRLGDYEVCENYEDNEGSRSNWLGNGGYGSVFIGKDTRTNHEVAVKIVERSDKTKKYIDREFSLLHECKHNNIIEVFHMQLINTKFYIVMEYCRAGNLNQYVETNSITYERCVSFMEDITAAVNFLHNEEKVHHRDIKPDNVLISDATVAKLTDFGLAKKYYVTSTSAVPGSVVGTPHWMPPEMNQHPSKYDFSVDIFPLGLLFHAMISLLPNRGRLQPIMGEYPGT